MGKMAGNIYYKLPERLRSKLKAPLGQLVKGPLPKPYFDSLKKFKSAPYLITVGDVVTENVIKLGIKPDVAIYDHKTERKVYNPEVNSNAVILTANNPPATITKALLNAIKKSIELAKRGKGVHIKICGEEDLAAIPAVIYAPAGSLVIYGQPKEGIVLINVTPETKLRFAKLLREMEVVKDGD